MERIKLERLSKIDLLSECEKLGIKKCKSKTKGSLIELIISQKEEYKNEYIMVEDGLYTLVDLCTGTGAFSYAFHQSKVVKTIFANDLLSSSKEIFDCNNKDVKLTIGNLIDISDNDIPHSDILTSGFPCQGFSIAGKQKGFEDERSNVFWKLLSLLKHNKPRIVIFENVKNLQSHDKGNTFKIIIEKLEELNYHIKHSILNTCKKTGIPQNRERIYIVCFLDKSLYDKFNFDFPDKDVENISQFLQEDIPLKYYYSNSTVIYDELKTNVVKNISTNTVYQYRRYYVRENKTNVCPTLTANMGTGGHNVPIILDDKGIRKLTPRECFNLQGFPKDYKLPLISDCKLYSLAGNAVSVPVVKLIVDKIVDILMC